MIVVLDASVVIDLLLDREPYSHEIEAFIRRADLLAAPHLLDVEVAQVLRRFLLRGELGSQRARQALHDLVDCPIQRYAHYPLIARAFQLAHNLTIYDAAYVVLTEALDATLLTRDSAMEQTPGTDIKVQLIGR